MRSARYGASWARRTRSTRRAPGASSPGSGDAAPMAQLKTAGTRLAALPRFALDRMGAALDDQLPGPDRFSTSRTHCARMELGATGVLEDDRRGARVQLLIAPFLERKDDGAKLEP